MIRDIRLRIKQLRNEKKLTQDEFSNILGIKQANLSHIENKGSKISVDILDRIISNFDINADWLLYGKGKIFRNEQTIGDISKRTVVSKNIHDSDISIQLATLLETIAENYNVIIKRQQEQIDGLISIINKLSSK
jgi:transcriptional regulator with XRE-family HTH domain